MGPNFKVYQPVPVASAAEGDEALAQGVGQLSQGTAQAVATGGMLTSREHLLLASNTIMQQQMAANLAIRQNPENATEIANQYNSASQGIINSATLNSDDKYLLQRMTGWGTAAVNAQAQSTVVQQGKLKQQTAWLNEYPGVVQQYNKLYLTDPESAGQLAQKTIQTAQALTQQGVLTPNEYANTVKTFTQYAQIHGQIAGAITNGQQASAEQYHQYLHATGQSTAQAPVNGNVSFVHSTYNNDITYQDAKAAIVSGRGVNINYNAVNSMTPNDRNAILQGLPGAVKANAAYTSGVPRTVLQQQYQTLSKIAAPTYQQQFERDTLYNILNRKDYVDGTSIGQQLDQKYTQQMAAISGSSLSPTQQQAQQVKVMNNYASEYINAANAMHAPATFAIPPNISGAAQQAFGANADPTQAIKTLQMYKPQLRPYFANAMKTAPQQMTMYLAGYSNPEFGARLIKANQTGINYSTVTPLDNNQKPISDAALTAKVAQAISTPTQWMSGQPNSASQISNLIKVATNDVRYQCLANGDLTCKNLSDYINDTANNINKAFPVITGDGYSFNRNQLPIGENDAPVLSNFMKAELGKYVPTGALDNESLTVTNSNKDIIVMNSNHDILFKQPYTQSLLAAAYTYQRQQEQQRTSLMQDLKGIYKTTDNAPPVPQGLIYPASPEDPYIPPKEQ